MHVQLPRAIHHNTYAQEQYAMHTASLRCQLGALVHSHVSCATASAVNAYHYVKATGMSFAFKIPRDVRRRSSQIFTAKCCFPCKAASCIGIRDLHLHQKVMLIGSNQASHYLQSCALTAAVTLQPSTLGLALADVSASGMPGKETLVPGAARADHHKNKSWHIKHANSHLPIHRGAAAAACCFSSHRPFVLLMPTTLSARLLPSLLERKAQPIAIAPDVYSPMEQRSDHHLQVAFAGSLLRMQSLSHGMSGEPAPLLSTQMNNPSALIRPDVFPQSL